MTLATIKPLKTEADYEAARSRMTALMGAAPDSPEADELDVLATLVEAYEEQHYAIDLPDPIAAITFRLEQLGLTRRYLVPYLGGRAKVSEVLSGKRSLTLRMIRVLHQHLHIPAEVLLQEPPITLPENLNQVNWSQYPLREMAQKGWIESRLNLSEHAEEIMRNLIERAGGYEIAAQLFGCTNDGARQHTEMDIYALHAWGLQLLAIANAAPLPTQYQPGSLTDEWLQALVRLSSLEAGPQIAQDYLAKQGIHLIYLPPLSRTSLDGAALRLANGAPVIGLTLRYDRLDSFWFTLCYELVHHQLHFHGEQGFTAFFDDLSLDPNTSNSLEKDANAKANNILIPPKVWSQFKKSNQKSGAAILALADRLQINPAIIAGRIRKEAGNPRLLGSYIGANQVRKFFR